MEGGQEEFRNVKFTYGLVMLKTKKGLRLLDRFGSFKITRPLAWFMLYLMPVAGAAALYLILNLIAVYLSPQGAAAAAYIRTLSPLSNLLIPGINPYVPIVYGWIALVVAVFIHEASHGIVARSLNLPVKSAGVLFFLILPVGAFVEIDDSQLKSARGRDTARVLAAGSGINVILAFLALALLILSVSTMAPAVQGAAIGSVTEGSSPHYTAAYLAGIRPGDFITAINSRPVTDLSPIFGNHTVFHPGQSINITIWRSGQTLQLHNVVLGEITYIYTPTNRTFNRAFLGVGQISYRDLQNTVSTYSTQYSRNILAYVAWIPTFPRFAASVPFSDTQVGFYRSSLGVALPFVTNVLFWLWFVNINLAIFNSLPIYPMDGGQAFENAMRAVGRGKISDEFARRITTSLTLIIVIILVGAIAGPYLTGLLPA